VFERERPFQNELYRLISNVVKDRRFAGLMLSVQTDFPVDYRFADVVVLKEPEEIPILIVETKRKIERKGYYRKEELFDPYGHAVIGQALSYAALVKEAYNLPATPAFATANRDVIVLFSPVKDPRKYLNWEAVEKGEYEQVLEPGTYVSLIHEHYLLDDKNPLREELLQHILDQVSRIWQREVLPEAIRKRPGDWLIGKLKYFVDSLSRYYVEDVLHTRLMDDKFAANLNALAVKAGYRNGLADIVGQDYSRVETLARMMVYVLMNKIIFYKVLERHYMLPELKPILKDNPEISSEKYLELLNQHFSKAIEVTGDFEQIFITGLFDHIVLSEERGALTEIDEFIRLLSAVEVERLGDVIGPIYEDLIPAEERHQMGQFYTPQPIAELIAKWCIKNNPSALILGPGCGSGTFEVEAYWILSQLKTGRRRGIPPGKDVHKSILKQIYAIDINPFPTQLTAMNLAMKNVRAPTTEANIVTADFFSIIPGQKVIAPHPIMTPSGPKHKEIIFPEDFDVVMGNPPYSRWNEIPESVLDRILSFYSKDMEQYGLYRFVTGGALPSIFIPWIMHSAKFLKNNGRLGMIISDSWLQTKYGIGFIRYLSENFKIYAVIDISTRVFPVPLIGTCIILLEKCPDEGERNDNFITLMYLHPKSTIDVDHVLKVLEDSKGMSGSSHGEEYFVRIIKQTELNSIDFKPIRLFFDIEELLKLIASSNKVVRLGDIFQPSEGNTAWSVYASIRGRGAGVGGEDFYYLDEDSIEEHYLTKYLEMYLKPLVSSPDHLKYFIFTREDWEKNKEYMFLANSPRNSLPLEIQDYIRLGETEILITKGPNRGQPVSRSSVARIRERLGSISLLGRRLVFHGWYDLGGVIEAPIYVTYGARYWIRFVLASFQCALDHRILALIPKQGAEFSDIELKALLAYLNSSFSQLQAEVRGRTAGGVALLELDVKPLSDFLILDVKKLPKEDVEELANLFDKLENEARRLGGVDKVENVFGSDLARELTGRGDIESGIQGIFNTVVKEIDEKIAEILEVEALVEPIRTMIVELARRRLSRAMEVKLDALRGSEEPLRRSGRKRGKRHGGEADKATSVTKLTDFI
jgi:type I restriction-modification system DNA methylase subunit